MLGEHTTDVLRELLGMSSEAVATLREQGVIGGPSTR
jgi:crotonobetainyl-CoA:carnitine CoA-transferase CaiB-like acyl-CoA transferase